MKLSRGEAICLCIVLMGSLFFYLPIGHSEENQFEGLKEGSTFSAAVPTLTLFEMAQEADVTISNWTVYWREQIQSSERETILAWLTADQFSMVEESTFRNSQGISISKQVWEKKIADTVLQMELFTYPHEPHQPSNYIYTWSGTTVDANWSKSYEETENELMAHVKKIPQIFSCIEGFTNDKLKFDLSDQNMIDNWTKQLEGEMTHRITDSNYISVTGYIPAWGQQYVSTGDDKMNLQLSARYNALIKQTQVTIGYPLILKEH